MRCRCSRRHVIAPTRRSEQVGRWRGPSATRRTAAAAGSDPPGTSPAGRAASRFNGRGQQAAHRSYRRTEGAVSGGRAGRWHRIRRAASAAVPAPTCCASWTTPGRQHLPGIPCGQQNGRDLPLLATLRADNAISPEGYLMWGLARSVPRRVHVISRASRVEQRGRNHRDPRPRRRPGAQDLISGSASARRATLH
jgi:hypothetical protein